MIALKNRTRVLSQVISVILLSILTCWFFNSDIAVAHVPHDVVFDVEISPDYERDRTVFHLIDSGNKIWGNVFQSEDGGDRWQRIEGGLDNQHPLGALAVAPQARQLYLATLGDGIYKSQDGGTSWFKIDRGLATSDFDLIAVAPDDPEVVLAAGTKTGLYQSNNGGADWYRTFDGDGKITAIAFAADNPKQIALGDSDGNLYLSGDRGRSWQPMLTITEAGKITAIAFAPDFSSEGTLLVGTERQGVFKTVDSGSSVVAVNRGLSDLQVVSLGISPNYENDATLFAATWHQGVFVSDDGGDTWQRASRGLTKTPQADKYGAPNFQDLTISPAFERDRTVFVSGFDGLFKSTDGGSSWQDARVAHSGANKVKKLALSPNYQQDSTVAIAAYYDGAYLSQTGGSDWTKIDRGLKEASLLKENLLTNVLTLTFSPNYSEDNTLFACATGSFFKSSDRGRHWQHLKLPRAFRADQYMIVSPNYATDRTIYLFNIRGGVLRSTDGGESFAEIANLGSNAAHIPSLAISSDFASDRTIFVGGFPEGLYKTTDGGRTWQLANNGITTQKDYFALAVSPNYREDRTVFAGTEAGIFKTSDGGNSWSQLTGTAGGAGYIDEIAISPNYQNDSSAIASVRGKGLFKTSDGGTTFTKIDDYVAGPIAFSPTYAVDRTIYTSSDAELHKSTDGGQTWNTLTIPTANNNRIVNYLTYIYLKVTESPLRKFIAAVAIALLSYLLVRASRLAKRLHRRQWQIDSVSTFTVFIGIFIFLSI